MTHDIDSAIDAIISVIHVSMCVYVYIYIYIYIYSACVYIYIYIHTHRHIHDGCVVSFMCLRTWYMSPQRLCVLIVICSEHGL